MNVELQWKLQAWVDDELPDAERPAIASLVERDPEARALVAELKMTQTFLAGNELEPALPESHDFFWSKVQREIQRQDPAAPSVHRPQPWIFALRRFLVPVSSVALVAFLSVLSLNEVLHRPADDTTLPFDQLVETENLSEHVGSISYKSQTENMFVVYLYDKEQEQSAPATTPELEFEAIDDDILLQ